MRARSRLALAVACVLTLPAVSALAQKKAPDGAKVLILSGGQRQHHGYREQAFYLANLLEDTKKFEVTICEDAAIVETPAMKKYDVLIVTSDRRDPEFKFTRSQQEDLLNYVKDGHGYISIHGGDNAAPDWLPEWREMLGGVFSHIGEPNSKTKRGTYQIKIADTSHPIMRDLQEFTLNDELYYKIQMKPNVEPLATTDYEGATWPVAWTRVYGKGRVFHTPLGHRSFGPNQDDPLQNPSLSKMIVQGAEWVAEGAKANKAP